ncbi:MAG TPA: FAD-dependent oxidoreductase [Chitinophagaceae bacterium]|nr:FAD-dependent oxidoreductase [Chitinophagaceae bacterium]
MKRRNFIKSLTLSSGAIVSAGIPAFAYINKNKTYNADIVIYGGTSAAVIAAVRASKLGKSVIMVSPDKHLGGLTAGGLGFTDTGNKSVIGGLSREFYHRIFLHYQKNDSWKWQKKETYGNKGQGTPAIDGENRTMWIFEPHAAEGIFEDFVKENHIQVLRNEWLDRENGVKMRDGKIVSIKTLDGSAFTGKMFIDATYEGDLMAAAGVGFFVGREANSVYNEKWNGVETGVFQHGHHFKHHIDPYKVPGDPSSGLLPLISAAPPGIKGEGDKRIQAYCYRMCLTNNPENRVPFPRPTGYDPGQYELLIRVFNAGWRELFHKFDPIPNMKTDTNNHGPFSTDNIGMNYAYPEGSYKIRQKIIEEHQTYQKGLMYFMATDPRMPREVQQELNTWGLTRDEFADTGNWPHQLYVREARRMVSDYVMTENEILGKRPVTDSIGMGSYGLDSHNTQRYVTPEGYAQNEGDIGVGVPRPYGISYKAIIPKEQECRNLLVPICASSSHIAYGSIRMEPVFMILGDAAATAAASAIDDHVNVQQVNYGQLKRQLLQQNQHLTLEG